MKKLTVVASFLAVAGLASASVALAIDPSNVSVRFTCPSATGQDAHALANLNDHIAGYGEEAVNGNQVEDPLFTYAISEGANIPEQLTSYASSGTSFDNDTGTVLCNYSSSEGFDSFAVGYALNSMMPGAKQGTIVEQAPDKITIALPIDMRSRKR